MYNHCSLVILNQLHQLLQQTQQQYTVLLLITILLLLLLLMLQKYSIIVSALLPGSSGVFVSNVIQCTNSFTVINLAQQIQDRDVLGNQVQQGFGQIKVQRL